MEYHIKNDRTNDILVNDLEIHFIELKKFKFSDIKKLKKADSWIAYFSPECTDEEREVIAMSNPAIKEALNYEMMFSQDEIKRREYELQEKAMRDYRATMLYNRKEGEKIGEKIGEKKGEKKGAKNKANKIAINLLKANMSIEFVAQNTELSIEEVKELQKNLSK